MAATRSEEGERFQADGVLTLSGGHAVHDTYTAFLPPLLPTFIAKFALSKTEAGLLTVFMQIPSLLLPVIGHLADRASLRTVVILAPAVTGILISMLGVASSYPVLVLVLMAAGLSSAAWHAVGPVMAGRLSGANLGRGMGFWMLGGEFGRTLGPIVVVTVVGLLTLSGLPWSIPLGLLASVVLYTRFKGTPEGISDTGPGLAWRPALRRMRPVLVPLVGVIGMRSFLHAGLATYLPTLLREEGAAFWLAGASLSVYTVPGLAGALFGGWISDRLGRRRVIWVSMLLTSILTFVFLWADGWMKFPVLLVLGLTALSTGSVFLALMQESFPENRAFANGIFMSMSFCIRSVTVVILGMLADQFGLREAFMVSAALMLLGLPLVFLLPEKE